MNIYDVKKAVKEAERDIAAADSQVGEMLSLIVGRLKKVKGWNATEDLKALKKELKDFDSRTGEWKCKLKYQQHRN